MKRKFMLQKNQIHAAEKINSCSVNFCIMVEEREKLRKIVTIR